MGTFCLRATLPGGGAVPLEAKPNRGPGLAGGGGGTCGK